MVIAGVRPRSPPSGTRYQKLLEKICAVESGGIDQGAAMPASYDTTKNLLPAFFQSNNYAQLLEYILYSRDHTTLAASLCKSICPMWPLDCDNELECQVRDHYPVICHYQIHQGLRRWNFFMDTFTPML